MSRNNSAFAVLFVCCFRLFTAFLIKAEPERKFNDTSFNFIPGFKGATWKHETPYAGDVPPFFDWRKNAGVTPVKDQNQCSACWAFSSVAAIESQLKIHTKQDVILSEQFLIDCNDMDVGCNATSLLKTYGDITSLLTGVMREGDYRRYDETKRRCEWNGDPTQLVPTTGFRRVAPLNEVDMVTYLYHNGPLSAGINDATMVHYNFRVKALDQPTPYSCPNDVSSLNHAVLTVGYDTWITNDGTQIPHWIIKNSWGTDWGDGGFYYLERGTNACGIANDVIFPFVP